MRETIDSGQAGTAAGTGELVANRYRIARWLGAGGMGSVYRAFDTELGDDVALKMLHRGLSDHALERFRREVKLTRRVVHKNVARMFDIGEHHGQRFLTMELVDGPSLSRLIAAGLVPWSQIIAIAQDVCAGLSAVHAAGVVHRDLKPDNVLVASDGRAVVTDFGIARATDDMSTTQLGTIIGTPNYMAPEQIEGGIVDAPADVFSLGVMLFELATLVRPWEATTPLSLAVAITTRAPRSLRALRSDAPPAYVAIVEQCLQPEPALRPDVASIGRALASATTVPERISIVNLEPVGRPTTIAVRPFEHEPDLAYAAAELVDEVADALSRRPGFRVRVIAATGDPGSVDHVIEGAVRRDPHGELRVAVRLLGAADGFQIWSDRVTGSERELLMAPHAITNGIVTALSSRAIAPPRPADPRAAELYLRAREEIRRYWGSHVLNAVRLLEEAAALAPDSAPIHATLALACVRAWVLREEPELADAARRAIARATAIDPQRREARLAVALHQMNTGDMTTAAYELGAALARAPMAAAAHDAVGKMLLELGEIDEGRQRLLTAFGLEPERRLVTEGELARVDELLGDHAACDARLAQLEADPDHSLRQVGIIYRSRMLAWRGDLGALERAVPALDDRVGETTRSSLVFLAGVVRAGGLSDEAWQRQQSTGLANHRPLRARLIWAQILAEVCALLGQRERAIEATAWCAQHGLFDVVWIRRCPPIVALFADAGDHLRAIQHEIDDRATQMLAAFRSGLSSG